MHIRHRSGSSPRNTDQVENLLTQGAFVFRILMLCSMNQPVFLVRNTVHSSPISVLLDYQLPCRSAI